MSPAHIVRRRNADGRITYHVRYRRGGRSSRLRHAGAFPTLKLAQARQSAVNESLAKTGTWDPDTRDERPGIALGEAYKQYIASRHDLSARSRFVYEQVARSSEATLREAGITRTDDATARRVASWVAIMAEGDLAPNTVRQRVSLLGAVLSHFGVDPNPVRDPRVRLPRARARIPNPPTRAEVDAILDAVQHRYRLPIRVLEATGLRASELLALSKEDLDLSRARLRVQGGKTRAARRWVPVPADLGAELERALPFQLTAAGLRMALHQACKVAGTRHFSPHDLRHRYISLQVLAGVPITIVQERAGHANASMTLDIYSHVILED